MNRHASFFCMLFFSFVHAAAADDENERGTIFALESMFAKMEMDTLQFARKMEELLSQEKRCSPETMQACSKANYHTCDSEFPLATCPGKEFALPICGKGNEGGCSSLHDFTSSGVRVVPEKRFSFEFNDELGVSDRVKDGVCSTLQAEEFIVELRENSKEYWNSYSVASPKFYFGSEDGVFRMIPGSPTECPGGLNDYNPTNRPWYVSASSGPKDVILILDTSGSMREKGRLETMKSAAKRVVDTLGFIDYFTVIEFNSDARQLLSDSGVLMRATDENKRKMISQIEKLTPDGATNFYSGFDLAFNIISQSDANDITSGCHRAILFLTDGIMGDNVNTFFQLIEESQKSFEGQLRDPPVFFTYSFGSGADKQVPKRLACENGGIWADIEDGGDLSKAMGAYYKYFGYGLGAEGDDFVAWAEPYEFFTKVGLGTTASSPVYDHSVFPPILVGVVGSELSFTAMEIALGKNAEETKRAFIKRIADRSSASCHKLQLTECQLESLRKFGSSDEEKTDATCGNECSFVQPLKPAICSNLTYPLDIWNNENNKGRTYEERLCCHVGAEPRIVDQHTFEEIKNDLVCVEKGRAGKIAGGIIGGILGVPIVIYLLYLLYKRIRGQKDKPVVAVPSPSAPEYNPAFK